MRLTTALATAVLLTCVASPAQAQAKVKRVAFPGPTNSSPITASRDGKLVFSVNPQTNTVSVIRTDKNTVVARLKTAAEPRSVAVTPDTSRLFVANAAAGSVNVFLITDARPNGFKARKDTKADGKGTIRTGAEPWNVVVTPDGTRAIVANSAQDTLTVIDATNGRVIGAVNVGNSRCNDPNRARLFQPRGLAVSKSSNRLFVTSFFAFVRPGAIQATDNGREGAVCRLDIKTSSMKIRDYKVAQRIALTSQDTGFTVDKTGDGVGDPTAAFPNQMQSIVIRGSQLFLPNIAASPEGPLRFNVDTEAFVNVIDGANSRGATDASAGKFVNLQLGAREPETGKTKLFFANAWAIGFTNLKGSGNAYVVSAGSDLLIKVTVAADGKLANTVDADTTRYIDLNDPANPATQGDKAGKNPQGIAVLPNGKRAYVQNDVSGNVSIVDTGQDRVVKVIRTSPLPAPGSQAEINRVGAEVFFSSRGRFDPLPGQTSSSTERLSSEGWQSCASCHFQGRTDGVIWQFGTGPRKSVPLQSTFNPNNPDDQRVLNYSAIFDEIEDFEANIRNVSGPGALATPVACFNPPAAGPPTSTLDPNHGLLRADNSDPNAPPCTLNTFALPNAPRPQHTITLPGSSTKVPALTAMKEWVRRAVRTPAGQLTSDQAKGGASAADIARGRQLFTSAGCTACHGGPNWTVSTKDFTSPPAAAEIATETVPAPQFGRPIGAQYMPRFLRDIGSYKAGTPDIDFPANTIGADEKASAALVAGKAGIAPDGLGIDFNGDGKGNGFNVPSLLGINVVQPYYHNGACETLACVVDDVKHRTAKGTKPDTLTDPADRKALVAFLKTISKGTPAP